MICPKCGFDQPAGALDCARCGIVFAKFQREQTTLADPQETATRRPRLDPTAGQSAANRAGIRESTSTAAPAALPEVYDETALAQFGSATASLEDAPVTNGRIGRSELLVLGSGLAAAIVVYAVPFTRMVFSLMVTLFHEFGHAVMGWLFGIPSLPAFDFVYGGGWTHYGNFRPSIALLIAGAFVYALWLFRANRKSMALIAALFLMWLLIVSREWRRELVIASAGHAAEFVLAGIFFYMALAGVGWKIPEIERPLGAFVAFFVQIHSMAFAWRLGHDADFLAWYREGKGGAAMNDLEIVSLDLNIYAGRHTTIESVATLLLLFSFVPIAVALLWYFQRARWHRLLRRLVTADA